MTSRTFSRLGGASLIILSTVVACSGARMGQRPAIASSSASSISTGIERALAAHDYASALLDAERLVEAQPREASARTLLGRAYLANGRYASARTAFEDAMALGANDPRTLISLALVRTAMGSPDGARALLSANIDHLPASDYGLAMAMAGDANEGVRALLEAVRAPEADAQTRQNLAYALALSGQWGQSRLVAGQDLSGSQLQQRLALWAASAQADAYPQRVASFIGVLQRSDDSGLPARLALSNSEPTSLAEARPLEPAAMAVEAARQTPAPQNLAEAQPEQVAPAPTLETTAEPAQYASINANAAFAPRPVAVPVPVIHASADPMREAVMKRLAEPSATPKDRATQTFAGPRNHSIRLSSTSGASIHGGSDWVVQIGAFNNSQSAATAWTRVKGKSFETRGYRKITGTVSVGGQTYHRLAMSGFGNRGEADRLCASLRSLRQTCFVRRDAGVANDIRTARAGKTVKTAAAAKPEKIASR
ncbi:MAG TPA: SPOR domain-containing protein [Sphingobium sp.]|uniref:SPOR domain-containing protein n=1 Tax=Sphingobium sp. TaxID=1912891 RepID=UPI002ED2347C